MIEKSGIHQLDVQKNLIQQELNNLRDYIIQDENLIFNNQFFNFLSDFF